MKAGRPPTRAGYESNVGVPGHVLGLRPRRAIAGARHDLGDADGAGGCQNVLHTRLKRPGAHWDIASAEQMVRARAVLCSQPAPRCSHPHDRLAS